MWSASSLDFYCILPAKSVCSCCVVIPSVAGYSADRNLAAVCGFILVSSSNICSIGLRIDLRKRMISCSIASRSAIASDSVCSSLYYAVIGRHRLRIVDDLSQAFD